MGKYIDDVFERYQQNAADFEDKHVLETGAGTGRVTDYYIAKAGKVMLTDGSKYMSDYLKKKYSCNPNVTSIECRHEELRQKVSDAGGHASRQLQAVCDC